MRRREWRFANERDIDGSAGEAGEGMSTHSRVRHVPLLALIPMYG